MRPGARRGQRDGSELLMHIKTTNQIQHKISNAIVINTLYISGNLSITYIFLYNTTLKLTTILLIEWLQWQKEIHIPRNTLGTGLFINIIF